MTRKSIFTLYILVCLLSLCVSSCSHRTQPSAHPFGKPLYTPGYAKGFRILGSDSMHSTVIETITPWTGTDGDTVSRLLIAAPGEEIPPHFPGQILRGPATRIAVMSSTHIAMLDALGKTNTIVAVSDKDYITNPAVANNPAIPDIGYEGDPDYETLVSLRPDLVLLYGITSPSPMEGKLRQLSIPYMYVGDFLEESPLGKAEWVMALAQVTGARQKGEEVYSHIPEQYNRLKNMVKQAGLPPVPVMAGAPYGDSWFMPSTLSYAVRLIDDAGGRYLFSRNNTRASIPIDREEALQMASKAQVWINVERASSMAAFTALCPQFTQTPPFTSQKIYNNNKRSNRTGGNDYYERGIMEPHIILRDLIRIFHPTLVSDSLVYYRHLQ